MTPSLSGLTDVLSLAFSSLFLLIWAGWLVLWGVMAFRTKATAQSESAPSRLSHVVPLLFAGYLLAAPEVPIPLLNERFVPLAIWPAALGAVVTFAGFLFSIWARFELAGNWSGFVQIKHDHEFIVGGPYRWVRHPIYTGLLLMFVGTALAVGERRAPARGRNRRRSLLAKLRLEEDVMRQQFGEAYGRYATTGARADSVRPLMRGRDISCRAVETGDRHLSPTRIMIIRHAEKPESRRRAGRRGRRRAGPEEPERARVGARQNAGRLFHHADREATLRRPDACSPRRRARAAGVLTRRSCRWPGRYGPSRSGRGASTPRSPGKT